MTPDLTSLLTAAGDGDRSALAHLYDSVGTDVYRTVAGRVGTGEATDVAEQALIEVWRWSPRYDPNQMDASEWIMEVVATAAGEPRRAPPDEFPEDGEPPPTLRQAVLERLDDVRQVARPLPHRQFAIRLWALVTVVVLVVTGIATVIRQLEDPFTTVASESDAAVVDVHLDDGSNGEFAFSPGLGQIAIRFADLSDPAPAGTYQLWLIDQAGESIPSILFTPDEAGNVIEAAETDIHGLSAVVVSREPAGGSGTPGDDIVLIAPFDGLGEDEDHA